MQTWRDRGGHLRGTGSAHSASDLKFPQYDHLRHHRH